MGDFVTTPMRVHCARVIVHIKPIAGPDANAPFTGEPGIHLELGFADEGTGGAHFDVIDRDTRQPLATSRQPELLAQMHQALAIMAAMAFGIGGDLEARAAAGTGANAKDVERAAQEFMASLGVMVAK